MTIDAIVLYFGGTEWISQMTAIFIRHLRSVNILPFVLHNSRVSRIQMLSTALYASVLAVAYAVYFYRMRFT